MNISDPLDPQLRRAVMGRLDWLARPSASLAVVSPLDDPRCTPTSSYLGGHPYLPAGRTWPSDGSGPMAFVLQVNFADVPPLPGFPQAGLLQWFVGATDAYGLTFDQTAGATGFAVRWFYPLSEPAAASPTAPVPELDGGGQPCVEAGLISFAATRSLPDWESLPEVARQDPIWLELGRAYGEVGGDDPAFCYNEYARGGGGPDFGVHETGSRIGGFPSFTQTDPHGTGAYAAPGSKASALLVELDAGDVGGWADAGIAHLFGDPGRIGYGDLSSVRYHWDCY